MNMPEIRPHDMSLIDAFPCLRAKKLHWVGNDSLAFQTQVQETCYSTGEYLAVALVLHVWDSANPFDLHRSINCWDSGNLAASQSWVTHPWYQ